MSGGKPVAETPLKIGVVTVSDRASRGEYEDRGGPAIEAWLTAAIRSPWLPVKVLIADEQAVIARALTDLVDQQGCCLVITTGGTGPSPRDVTPEATAEVCTRMMPGFGEAMRSASLARVPTAILSRQTAGLRGQALIINLPGKPGAIAECLEVVFPAVPYCVELAGGPCIETHPEFVKAFRPKSG